KQAQTEKEVVEQEVYQACEEFRNNDLVRNTDLADLKKVLKPNEVFIDFLFYHQITDWKTLTKEERLVAFVITQEQDVIRFDLGSNTLLKSAIKAFRYQLQDGSPRVLENEQSADEYLSETLWKPLNEYIKDKDTVYLIPDGDLAFIPFESLPLPDQEDKQYVAEVKNICYLFSPIDLVEYELLMKSEQNTGFLCLGDVAYSDSPEVSPNPIALRSGGKREEGVFWNTLEGTAVECEDLLKSFQNCFPTLNAEYLSQKKASKSYFAEKAPGKAYLHLATHGYFNETPLSKTPRSRGMEGFSENRRGVILLLNQEEQEAEPLPLGVTPMFSSGIVLAGANLKEEKETENGHLTAEELAGLNLKGTSLITLSACETALGEKLSGQGVSGLRLAVQVAGCKSMLLSLWKVDDVGTQLFMQSFYLKLWKERKGKLQALQETRLEWIEAQRQRKRGPNGEKIYAPSVWASFILSGQK
ncbi:MAG: CHAT domain-containing protein, partial [Planctomycetota bacterium]